MGTVRTIGGCKESYTFVFLFVIVCLRDCDQIWWREREDWCRLFYYIFNNVSYSAFSIFFVHFEYWRKLRIWFSKKDIYYQNIILILYIHFRIRKSYTNFEIKCSKIMSSPIKKYWISNNLNKKVTNYAIFSISKLTVL